MNTITGTKNKEFNPPCDPLLNADETFNLEAKRKNHKNRQLEIISKTLEIIGESGVRGVTTQAIADRIGFTEASLYKHFPEGKMQILQATIQFIRDNLFKNLGAIASQYTSAIERLDHLFKLHLDHINTNRGVPRLVYSSEAHYDPLLRFSLFNLIENYIRVIEEWLNSGIKNREFESHLDANAEARKFLAMIQFTAFRLSLSDFKIPLGYEGQSLWQSYLNSIIQNQRIPNNQASKAL